MAVIEKKAYRIFIFTLLLFVVIAMVSCKTQDFVCCYGAFSDSLFALIFSSQKNTLYLINIPYDTIIAWGQNEGIDSVPKALRNFAGIDEDVFCIGNTETLQACKDILDALSYDTHPSAESRLDLLTKKASIFMKEPLITNINRLCNADVSVLFKAMADKNVSAVVLDASEVLSDDIEFSGRYFKEWISQIIFR